MTKDQLRHIFRTMDGNRAQEIREAYYKAIEGLMTLARELELADADLARITHATAGRTHVCHLPRSKP